jgi:hypothetical protein
MWKERLLRRLSKGGDFCNAKNIKIEISKSNKIVPPSGMSKKALAKKVLKLLRQDARWKLLSDGEFHLCDEGNIMYS